MGRRAGKTTLLIDGVAPLRWTMSETVQAGRDSVSFFSCWSGEAKVARKPIFSYALELGTNHHSKFSSCNLCNSRTEVVLIGERTSNKKSVAKAAAIKPPVIQQNL